MPKFNSCYRVPGQLLCFCSYPAERHVATSSTTIRSTAQSLEHIIFISLANRPPLRRSVIVLFHRFPHNIYSNLQNPELQTFQHPSHVCSVCHADSLADIIFVLVFSSLCIRLHVSLTGHCQAISLPVSGPQRPTGLKS